MNPVIHGDPKVISDGPDCQENQPSDYWPLANDTITTLTCAMKPQKSLNSGINPFMLVRRLTSRSTGALALPFPLPVSAPLAAFMDRVVCLDLALYLNSFSVVQEGVRTAIFATGSGTGAARWAQLPV